MLNQTQVTATVPALVFSEYAPEHCYYVGGHEGVYYGFCYCGGSFHLARGSRTGKLVTFQRRSDAVRFVRARNRLCRTAH